MAGGLRDAGKKWTSFGQSQPDILLSVVDAAR
jgi:hypothetical protein